MTVEAVAYSPSGLLSRMVRSEFLRHGALIFGATMSLNAASYAFHFLMARRLGPEVYGSLVSLLAITAVITIPASIVAMIVAKYVAEFHALEEHGKIAALARLVVSRLGILAAAIVLCGLIFEHSVAAFVRVREPSAILLCAVIAAASIMLPALRAVAQGEQRFGCVAVSYLTEGAGRFVGGTALVYLGFGVRGALLGYLTGALLSLAYTASRIALRRAGSDIVRLDVRRMLQAFAAVALSIVALQVVMAADVIAVRHFFDARTAGLYGGMALAGKMLLFAVTFIPTILLPKGAAAAARGDDAMPLLVKAIAVTAVVCGAVLLAVALEPRLVLRVVAGTAYVAEAKYLLLYVTGIALLAFASVVANFEISLHRFRFIVPCALACLADVAALFVFHRDVGQFVLAFTLGNALVLLSTVSGPLLAFRRASCSAAPLVP